MTTPPPSTRTAATPSSSLPSTSAPPSERAGGTFVPLSATQPKARQLLILRNMLPNADFDHAVQNTPQTGDPSAAAKAMG